MQVKTRERANIGNIGEDLAAEYLKNNKFQIVARNVRYKIGEIDIVAIRKRELHFVEVKTRRYITKSDPFEAITPAKKRHMKKAADFFLMDKRFGFTKKSIPACFFTVIGVDLTCEVPKIECIVDAFE